MTRRTDGGNLCTSQTYEPLTGRVDIRTIKGSGTSCVGSTRVSINLDYDQASNITRRVQTVTGNAYGGTYDYTYDSAGRLETVVGPAAFGSRTYTWDGGSNRTSVQTGTGAPITTTYDAAGLPTSSTDGITCAHDEAGNLIGIDPPGSSSDRSFTYDAWSQLSSATVGGTQASYTTDALDRTLSRTASGTTSSYTYQGTGEALAASVSGGLTTTYAHTPGGPLAQRTGSTTRYYLRDVHTDLVGWSSTTGALVGTAMYDPWGGVLSATGEMATVPAQGALRFQSDLTDALSAQVDMGARAYEPTLGRFSSADPLLGTLSAPISLNRYLYGGANPVTFDDPTGLCANPDICPPQIGFGTTLVHSESWQQVGQIHIAAEQQVLSSVNVVPADFFEPVIQAPGSASLVSLLDTIGYCGGRGMFGQENSAKPYFSAGCGALLDTYSITSSGTLIFNPIPTEFRFDPDEVASRERAEESYFAATRARDAVRGLSVIGRFPDYLTVADRLGARRFAIPQDVWMRMSPAERWAANQRFLDRAVARGDEFVLASPLSAAAEGTTFLKELQYLFSKGYRLSSEGTSLVPSGGL